METVKIVGITFVSLSFLMVIRAIKGEMALPLSICISVMLMGCALSAAVPLIDLIKNYCQRIGGDYITVLLKSLGIAILTSSAAEISRDFGESNIAQKIELLGKCTILSFAVPIIKDLILLVTEVLNK